MAHLRGPHGTHPAAERRQGAPRYWDRIATQYDSGFDRIAGADLVAAVQTMVAAAVPPGDVVEVGCGTGLFTRAYARRCRSVVALDLSAAMVEVARDRLADLPQVRVQLADAAATELPAGSADCVVVLNLLHIVPDPAAILAEARRLLRPGGTLVAASLTMEGVPVWQMLRTGWRVLRLWGLIPGRRDLTRSHLRHLLNEAGLEVVEIALISGRAMNAVHAVAVLPGDGHAASAA